MVSSTQERIRDKAKWRQIDIALARCNEVAKARVKSRIFAVLSLRDNYTVDACKRTTLIQNEGAFGCLERDPPELVAGPAPSKSRMVVPKMK